MTTATANDKARQAKTRAAIRKLHPDHTEEIRQAYYKAAEGLSRLQELLDMDPGLDANEYAALTAERAFAKRAQQELDGSDLGAIL